MLEELLRQFRVKLQKAIKDKHGDVYDIDYEQLSATQFFVYVHINKHLYQTFWMDTNPRDPHWMKVYEF